MALVRPKFELRDTDYGWQAMVKAAKAIKESGAHVKVGYLGADAAARREDAEGLTNVELGLMHEFGTSTVPERSHLRHTFDKYRGEYEALAAKLLAAVLSGQMPLAKALNLMGLKHATDIKQEMAGGHIRQDLAPSTLARKEAKGKGGTPRALIDTGRLLGSISYAVSLRGGR